MSEQPDGDGRDEAGQDAETGRILTLESISERIEALSRRVEQALSGGGRGGGEPRHGGSGVNTPFTPGRGTQAEAAEERRREIREELAALKRQEAADAERADMAARLGKLEKAAERPPRELRRIEQFMGWHR